MISLLRWNLEEGFSLLLLCQMILNDVQQDVVIHWFGQVNIKPDSLVFDIRFLPVTS